MDDGDGRHLSRLDRKEDLIDSIRSTFGVEPQGLRVVINALSHPEVIDDTLSYFKALDKQNCLIYSYPWNCVLEAEAKYETIKNGWLGAGVGGAYDELWCANCRTRATNDI